MVRYQLYTLDHLKNARFGRPPPRHGLKLLFWFANCCVTCKISNSGIIMKLMSGCQPEKGVFGFHPFGNIEELLPVLASSKGRKGKRQLIYFEIGNLNTETYPGAAELPQYVRENYDLDDYLRNIDRIIISYHIRTKQVEKVYVTEHDTDVLGQFSRDRTHEISVELIQALQCPQLDLITFLARTDFYALDHVEDLTSIICTPENVFNYVQNHSNSSARWETDTVNLYPQTFDHGEDSKMIPPFRYDWNSQYVADWTSLYSQSTSYHDAYDCYWEENIKPPTPEPKRHWMRPWLHFGQGSDEEGKKWKNRAVMFAKVLVGAGLAYLAVKRMARLWSHGEARVKGLTGTCVRYTPAYLLHTPSMLDYVY